MGKSLLFISTHKRIVTASFIPICICRVLILQTLPLNHEWKQYIYLKKKKGGGLNTSLLFLSFFFFFKESAVPLRHFLSQSKSFFFCIFSSHPFILLRFPCEWKIATTLLSAQLYCKSFCSKIEALISLFTWK